MRLEPQDRYDSATAKYHRGQLHLAAIAQAVEAYQEDEPWTLKSEPDGDELVHRLTINRQPPTEWGPIVGDFLHNMRSALDNVACGLVHNFDAGVDVRNMQFPLNPAKLSNEAWRLGKNRRAIEVVAAIHRRHGAALELLQRLSNQDKHRMVTRAAVRMQVARLEKDEEGRFVSLICGPEVDRDTWKRPLESGDIVSRGKLPGAGVGFRLALMVDDEPIEIVELNKIRDAVAETLDFLASGIWPDGETLTFSAEVPE